MKRIVLALFICMFHLVTIAMGQGIDSNSFPSVGEMVTNCPPIKELIFKYEVGANAELYEFRFQSNGFFARISRARSFSETFALEDTACGRLDDDYWFYSYTPPPATNAPPVPPILRRYHLNPSDTYSVSYQSVNKLLLTRFRLFTSMGIAGDGNPGKLEMTSSNEIVYQILRQKLVLDARLSYSNSLPILATLKTSGPDGLLATQIISYRYEPGIARGCIPARIEGVGFSIQVMRLDFSESGLPSSDGDFLPPDSLRADKNLVTQVYSNSIDYVYAKNGKLLTRYSYDPAARRSNSQMEQKALSSGLSLNEVNPTFHLGGRRFVILAVFGVSLGILMVIITKSCKTNKSNKNNQIL